ncbi:endonuclease/exonuclease/phosphatase family protein [Luteolibacter sp. AS25]|uniref:endonuclease/exonuclease/phosphatase family protein n=1 Tax=Luteolibacter sp. AS25 TaxID=3135776 RepID=UPI00398AA7BA
MLEALFQFLAGFVIIGTFLPFVKCDYWMIRGWDFPRIQLFCVGLFAGLGLLVTRLDDPNDFTDSILLVALLVTLFTLFTWIFRYTPFHRKEVLDGKGNVTISFLVSNVLMSNRKSAGLVSHIRDKKPDMFICLETDQWWIDQIAVTKDEYPHGVEIPQEDTYGMIVRSRIPFEDLHVEYFIRDNIPSVHADFKLEDGSVVHLHAVHPKPPFPDENTDTTSTDRDAELLLVGKRVEKQGGPTIVLGDLNDVAWSLTTKLFQKTSGLLDPRVGRGLFNTFHAGHWFLRWPLDHIFISDHFRVRSLERLASIGSDHFPIFAEFSYEPSGANEQEAPEKSEGDDEEADEKIASAKNKNQSRAESLDILADSSI